MPRYRPAAPNRKYVCSKDYSNGVGVHTSVSTEQLKYLQSPSSTTLVTDGSRKAGCGKFRASYLLRASQIGAVAVEQILKREVRTR